MQYEYDQLRAFDTLTIEFEFSDSLGSCVAISLRLKALFDTPNQFWNELFFARDDTF